MVECLPSSEHARVAFSSTNAVVLVFVWFLMTVLTVPVCDCDHSVILI